MGKIKDYIKEILIGKKWIEIDGKIRKEINVKKMKKRKERKKIEDGRKLRISNRSIRRRCSYNDVEKGLMRSDMFNWIIMKKKEGII